MTTIDLSRYRKDEVVFEREPLFPLTWFHRNDLAKQYDVPEVWVAYYGFNEVGGVIDSGDKVYGHFFGQRFGRALDGVDFTPLEFGMACVQHYFDEIKLKPKHNL